jgi:hypothetical protein
MNSSYFDPLRSAKGRIILLLFPGVFLFVFIVSTWNDIGKDPSYYLFIIYSLCLGVMVFKLWGAYYKFAQAYRRKKNPDFPLTYGEAADYGYTMESMFNQSKVLSLLFIKHKDKELNDLAHKYKKLMLITFLSPFFVFFLAVLLSGLF